jgi:hypothetical protein
MSTGWAKWKLEAATISEEATVPETFRQPTDAERVRAMKDVRFDNAVRTIASRLAEDPELRERWRDRVVQGINQRGTMQFGYWVGNATLNALFPPIPEKERLECGPSPLAAAAKWMDLNESLEASRLRSFRNGAMPEARKALTEGGPGGCLPVPENYTTMSLLVSGSRVATVDVFLNGDPTAPKPGGVIDACSDHWVNPVMGFCGRCKKGE